MIAESTPVRKPADLPSLNRVALETRLRAAAAASTGPDGELNYDWMVMHIRLIHCDTIRVAHMAEKGFDRATRTRHAKRISAAKELLRAVLPALQPLLTEFADPIECSAWLKTDRVRESVRSEAFIASARAAGLPVVKTDLDYALVPQDDHQKEVFRGLARHVLVAMIQ